MRRLGAVVLPALAAIAVVAAVAPAAFTRVTASEPPAAYPASPLTVTGADPATLVARARECSAARDRPGTADYTRLSTLKSAQGRSPFAIGAPATSVVTLVNRKGQKFRLYISGGSADAVAAFIAAASACAEAFPVTSADLKVLVPVPVFQHVLDAAVAKSQKSLSALSQIRDGLAASGPASLTDVLTSIGADPASVTAAAITAANADVAARAADFSAAAVPPPNVTALVGDLMTQPFAPFLSPPGDDPRSAAERGKLLTRRPQDIVVGIDPVEAGPPAFPKQYVAWAAFDFGKAPARRGTASATSMQSLGYLKYDQYLAKCQMSATAQINAFVGRAQLKLWRMSQTTAGVQDWWNYATSSAATGVSAKLWNSWGSNRTYDTWVKGLSTGGTTYSMYYGWVKSTAVAGCPGQPS